MENRVENEFLRRVRCVPLYRPQLAAEIKICHKAKKKQIVLWAGVVS